MRARLPKLFDGVRVSWYLGEGRRCHGTVTAVYSDGRIDVESDSGNKFEAVLFDSFRRETAKT